MPNNYITHQMESQAALICKKNNDHQSSNPRIHLVHCLMLKHLDKNLHTNLSTHEKLSLVGHDHRNHMRQGTIEQCNSATYTWQNQSIQS